MEVRSDGPPNIRSVCRPRPPGREPVVLPPMPSLPRRVFNLAVAVAEFVASGCKIVARDEYEARLRTCESNGCGRFDGGWCRHSCCGCWVAAKATGRAWDCPEGLWPKT